MTNIVVPVKNPSTAKQRLADLLNAVQRKSLALALFDHVLRTLIKFIDKCGILVVTDSDEMIQRASQLGVQTLFEKNPHGETVAVQRATLWSCENGFDRQIVIPGDLPCLAEEDIQTLLFLPALSPSVVLCPATDDDGTNAIMTTPSDILTFRFGAQSFPDYVAQANSKHIPCHILHLPSLVLDLDTPEDVKTFLEQETHSPVYQLLKSWLPELTAVPEAFQK